MRKVLINAGLLAVSFIGLGFLGLANAAEGGSADNGGNDCPVDLVTGLELNDEFGDGAEELTRCLQRRDKVKVVIQVNKFCRDAVPNSDCALNRPYALGNIKNMLADYEITHGMQAGKDFEVVAVVHSGGGDLVLQDGYQFNDTFNGLVTINNQYEGLVKTLMGKGVRFLFCQNTTRGFMKKGKLPSVAESTYGGGATEALIPGVEYTTAGVTAIAELQSLGYRYVQP